MAAAERSVIAPVAVEVLRLFCHILHMNFSSSPTSILNLTVSQESQSITEFYDTFGVGKYCQLFTHESIIDQYDISALYSPQTAPSPSTITTKISYTHIEPDPTHRPKRHPDPITRVATAHICGQTNGTSECSIT